MSEPDINHHSRSSSFSSSLNHRDIDDNIEDQRDLSMTSPNNNPAKRYATYELNWRDDNSDYNSNDAISDHNVNNNNITSNSNNNSKNSAQAARWSLPKSPPPTTPLPPIPRYSRKSTPITINTTRSSKPSDKNEDDPQSPFGGITVTTVKVVEILHSPTEDASMKNDEFKAPNNKTQKNHRPKPLNLSAADPVGIITSERSGRKQRSPPPPPLSASQPPPPLPQTYNFNIKNEKKMLEINKDPKVLKQKKRSSIINPQKNKRIKSVNGKKKPEMIIPKEMAFIDPRLLANNKSLLIRSPTANRNRKSVKRGGSIAHRKRNPPKNFEFAPTSNPIYSNDPTDMEADLPPIKHQMFPWLPGSTKPPQLLHASLVPLPRVNRVTNVSYPNNGITNNLTKNNDSINNVPLNRKRSSNFDRLSRVNSQRKRTSIVAPDPNRASLIFRRQILEESLMMSFGGNMMFGAQSQPIPTSKPPIRRRTKKGSNAKVEDREARRERRKKGKRAQNNASNSNNVNGKIEGTNIEKLENKIDNQKGVYMGPQPPPRKLPQDITINDHSPSQKPKNNALSLLASPPERRSGNSNSSNGSSLEPSSDEPFPTHLARSTSFSNKERSKRKQSPLMGQPASSFVFNYSNLEGEGSESVSNDLQYSSDETKPVQQLPSPTLTPNKSRIGFLGLFNKQTSPPPSQISSPTQLPLTPQSSIPSTPPQSPPLSPSRTLRLPQPLSRVGKTRRGSENGPNSPPAVQDQEKLKKMEKFEALIANSETPSNKKPITGKIKGALTTAITTVASTATLSSSSSTTSNTSSEKRKKSVDETPYHTPRQSNETIYKSDDYEKNDIKRDSSDRSSLTNSTTESIHYRPGEKLKRLELGPGDDGVIRVTLTPAVCR